MSAICIEYLTRTVSVTVFAKTDHKRFGPVTVTAVSEIWVSTWLLWPNVHKPVSVGLYL